MSDSFKMFQFVLVNYHGDDGDVDGSGHHGNNLDNLDSYIVFIRTFTYIIQPGLAMLSLMMSSFSIT